MKVKKEMLLMDYLLLSYNRKNAKNLLKYKQVYENKQQIKLLMQINLMMIIIEYNKIDIN